MSFYRGKQVLVTGGTGLIGRYLVKELLSQGAKVRIAAMDDPALAPASVEYLQVDLTQPEHCERACQEVDLVFNLVGIKGSPRMVKEKPATCFTPMILFNTNMLEAARCAGAKGYLYTSTVGVYAPAAIMREDDVWQSFPSRNDWYGGWAKRMGELQAEAYAQQYGWDRIAVVRPANVYGSGDKFDPDGMVVPSLIRRALEGENPLTVWGDGSAVRDFVHAEDVARGMLLALEHCPGPFKPVNLGSGRGYSVRELVEVIISQINPPPDVVWDRDKPTGDQKRVLDITRARDLLGWEPRISLAEGIKRVMKWYQDNKGTLNQRYNYTI